MLGILFMSTMTVLQMLMISKYIIIITLNLNNGLVYIGVSNLCYGAIYNGLDSRSIDPQKINLIKLFHAKPFGSVLVVWAGRLTHCLPFG